MPLTFNMPVPAIAPIDPPDVIDYRSDTLTAPDAAMREAMASAVVGDDVWCTDPTVVALERTVATACGKEAALFTPTGTMGNLICIMVHCDARLSEVVLGDRSHQLLYEVANLSGVAGVGLRPVKTNDDGTLDLDQLRAAIRGVDVHWPTTRAVLLENTHNFSGGRVLPLSYVREVRKLCDATNTKLHCDGARVWHAAVALDVPLATILEDFDSASVCLSKALGAPMGSVIVGTHDFIAKARRVRKMLGGGLRQVGVVAAAGLHAVCHMFDRLREDHAVAAALAAALAAKGIPTRPVETNIVFAKTPGVAAVVVERCAERKLLLCPIGPDEVRLIPHYGNTMDEVETAVTILAEVLAAATAKP